MFLLRCPNCGATGGGFGGTHVRLLRTLVSCAPALDVLRRANLPLPFSGLLLGNLEDAGALVADHYSCGGGRYELLAGESDPEIITADAGSLYDSAALALGLPPAGVVRDLLEDATRHDPPRVFRPSPGSQLVRRVVPRDDPVLLENYGDLMETQPPDAVVVEEFDGVYRWQRSGLVQYLHRTGRLDLNHLAAAYGNGEFTLAERMDLYRGLGYSLAGFVEVFGGELNLYDHGNGDHEASQ